MRHSSPQSRSRPLRSLLIGVSVGLFGCGLTEEQFVERSTQLYCQGVAFCDGYTVQQCVDASEEVDAEYLLACEGFDASGGRACLDALEAALPEAEAECEAFLMEIRPECEWSELCDG